MLLQRKPLVFVAPSGEKYLIVMLLKVRKWTVISPSKNYQNFLKRALLQRKKLRWPRLIWPTRVLMLKTFIKFNYSCKGSEWHLENSKHHSETILNRTINTFCRSRSLSNATFFSFLITWRSSSSKSASVYKISWKSDDFYRASAHWRVILI